MNGRLGYGFGGPPRRLQRGYGTIAQNAQAAITPSAEDQAVDPQARNVLEAVRRQFDAVRGSQSQGQSPGQCGERRFALPFYDLRVHFAGRDVADALCLAFTHRETIAQESSGIILDWWIADRSIAEDVPDAPAPTYPIMPLGSLHRSPDNRVLIERRAGFVTAFDVDAMQIFTVADGLDAIDTDLAAKPLLRILFALLMRHDLVLCHAALLGGAETGLLVTGKGGMGKSTISAAALSGGAGFCGDDFVALEQREDGLIGHSLFASLMLRSGHIDRFPPLAQGAVRYRSDAFSKHMVPVAALFPEQVRHTLRIDAVAVPEIVDSAHSSLVPGGRGAMLRAIAPSSVFSSPWREAERVRFLFDTISRLTPMVYRSGADFARIAEPLRARYG